MSLFTHDDDDQEDRLTWAKQRQARIAKLQNMSCGLLPGKPDPDPAPYRAWINQPSTQQPYHDLHGIRVLAMPESGAIRAYFLDGSVISIRIGSGTISEGWPPGSVSRPFPKPRKVYDQAKLDRFEKDLKS